MPLDLATYKTVRIAVSGDVTLTRLESRIIDTAPFQRLRAIKQLSTASLVYPTAVHTRFDHSLGTLATSLEMLQAIRDNHHSAPEERAIAPEQELLLRLFALLHDVTHIPFGHILEDEFCIFPRHDRDPERVEHFLGPDSRIGAILYEALGGELYGRLFRLFTARKETLDQLGEDCFIHDLVNDTLCADLLDYIRRDCYFCNIQLDTDYRFLKSLYLRREGGVRRAVIRLWKEGKAAPRRDTLNELIRLLDNRYLLGERVYFHHTKLVTGAMIAGAVARAVREGELSKADLYDLGDETLLDRLLHAKDPAARGLAAALRERKLWKNVFERTQRDVNAEQERLRDIDAWGVVRQQWHADPAARMALENRLAALLGLDEGDLLIHCPSPQMAGKFADMKVYWNGSLRSLRECTDDALVGPKLEIILRSHETLWSARVLLNPDHLGRRESVAAACNGLLTLDPVQRQWHEQRLLREAVLEAARRETADRPLLHEEFESRVARAVARLERDGGALQSREEVARAVRESFAS